MESNNGKCNECGVDLYPGFHMCCFSTDDIRGKSDKTILIAIFNKLEKLEKFIENEKTTCPENN